LDGSYEYIGGGSVSYMVQKMAKIQSNNREREREKEGVG
jgi:hypothetical protein